MSITNHRDIVAEMAAAYPDAFHHAHRGGPRTEEFIRLLASKLHSLDPRVGLNGKRGNPDDISDDALCLREPGMSVDVRTGERVSVVDVIGSAPSDYNGPDGTPSWGEVWDEKNIPTRAIWVQPAPWTGTIPMPVPPVPSGRPYPGDTKFWELSSLLEADYREAGRPGLDGGCGVWFGRVVWDYVHKGLSMDASIEKHRAEWRKALGL